MNRQRSGFGLYAAFMVIIVLAMFYITGKISAGSSPSQQKFETAVKDGKVTSAQIVQNKEVPTGSVVVREQGGDSYTVNVTDVNAAISLLEDADVTYTVQNVQRDSIFMTSVLPALLLGMILLFGMSMMNRSMGGGGGGGAHVRALLALHGGGLHLSDDLDRGGRRRGGAGEAPRASRALTGAPGRDTGETRERLGGGRFGETPQNLFRQRRTDEA